VDFRASHRFARTSARKARLVADMVRGKSVNRALAELRHTPRRASTYMQRLLESAVANVEDRLANDTTLDVQVDDLFVKEVRVDEGPTLKRWRPRSMGRANRILKRTCHMYVTLGSHDAAMQVAGGRGSQAEKVAAGEED